MNFALQRHGNPADLNLQAAPLLGGLENVGVFKVALTWTGTSGQLCSDTFVVKRTVNSTTRELAIWKELAGTLAASKMPMLYGAEWLGPRELYIYEEFVRQDDPWPWRNNSASVAVLKALADVHNAFLHRDDSLPRWDYEAELLDSAQATVELFASAVYSGITLGDRPMLRALERVVTTLPVMRTVLKSWCPLTLLHGDIHAGNAAVRYDQGGFSGVLLDWGRARFGSPLEDVSSWLQSVGYWEPEVKRRHDTLFRSYLRFRHLPDHLSPELRELYWIAAACNAMAGALRYHLSLMLDSERSDDERSGAFRALQDWLRIVRRADICWRN
ncbi:MAG: phosphotransferase family protein [Bryobacteraceae bacterium]